MFDIVVGYAFYVSDLEQSIKFYTEMLGFTLLGRSDLWGKRYRGLSAQVGLGDAPREARCWSARSARR